MQAGDASCQRLVAAVAKRLALRVLAGAHPVIAGLLGRVLHRQHAAALVGTVAEWLILAHAAGAPPIVLACLQRDFAGHLGGDNRLGHIAFLVALMKESRQWSAGPKANRASLPQPVFR